MEKKTNFQKWVELIGQAKVAEMLGLHRQQVNQWARQGITPSDRLKEKIVKISGLKYNDFFE